MKPLYVIYGDPDAGKSRLAKFLQERLKLCVFSTDKPYVDFIKSKWPKLEVEGLQYVIRGHYDMLNSITSDCSQTAFGGHPVEDWKSHLSKLIRKKLTDSKNGMAVEGYVTWNCVETLTSEFGNEARVLPVHVEFVTFDIARYTLNRVTCDRETLVEYGK